jgi:hypothetical protein
LDPEYFVADDRVPETDFDYHEKAGCFGTVVGHVTFQATSLAVEAPFEDFAHPFLDVEIPYVG